MRIPQRTSATLDGTPFQVPGDFASDRNVLLISFRREHAIATDAWRAALKDALLENPHVPLYRLPVIEDGGPLMRTAIDFAMRAAITNRAERAHVATIWTDVPAWLLEAGLPSGRLSVMAIATPTGEVLTYAVGLPQPHAVERAVRVIAGIDP